MTPIDDRLRPPSAPLTAVQVRGMAHALRAGRAALDALALEARIAAIDRVAASWLADDSPWRERALVQLPMSTGYPRAAIAIALRNLWQALRAPDLAAAVRDEALADACPGRPHVALHVLAGNVPGVGVFGIVAAALAGVPSLVKPAAREPFLPALLLESIAACAPELRAAIAVAPWRGGNAELDAAAFAEADVVLAYGRDATLDRIAARAPRLLRYGERLSVAVVAAPARTPATARSLAEQVALYDQQGCLSPQVACVEDDDPAATDRFAALVAEELNTLERELPRAAPVLPESAAVWRFLERHRWRAQEGAAVAVHGGRAAGGGVVVDRTSDWPLGPTFRQLVLLPIPRLEHAADVLQPLHGRIEAVGYAGPMRRVAEAADIAIALGAHRVCPLERLQAPPFGWRQSGHARLTSLLGGPPPIERLAAFA